MNSRPELENVKICVILPICDIGISKYNKSRASSGNMENSNLIIDYESSIESTFFSKPLISLTINSFERIPWIKRILLCSTSCRQEQIQEIIADYTTQSDRIKYLCTPNISINNGTANLSHHENTFNRLLKFSLNNLNREDEYDIIIVHDISLPYIEEQTMYNLTLEAIRHGVSCLGTNEVLERNTLFKLEDSNIENFVNEPNFMSPNAYRRSLSTGYGSYTGIDAANYKIGYKPQAFQFSIIRIIFENSNNDELDEDIDCIILAKKYADVKAKLVLGKSHKSSYSNRVCCISRYLKEHHKQALILGPKFNHQQEMNYLQSILRLQNWNVEFCHSLNKETLFKVNEMVYFRNAIDGISLIKFCYNLNDLTNFHISSNSENENENENVIENMESNIEDIISDQSLKLSHFLINHVVFLIKKDTISFPTTTPHETIRNNLKKNNNLSNIWHISILYNAINEKMANLIDYLLTDKNESIRSQILESE